MPSTQNCRIFYCLVMLENKHRLPRMTTQPLHLVFSDDVITVHDERWGVTAVFMGVSVMFGVHICRKVNLHRSLKQFPIQRKIESGHLLFSIGHIGRTPLLLNYKRKYPKTLFICFFSTNRANMMQKSETTRCSLYKKGFSTKLFQRK